MRIVLDTNILMRAARPDSSRLRSLLDHCIARPNELVISNAMLFEVMKVMQYPHVRRLHGLSDAAIDGYLRALAQMSHFVDTPPVGVGPLVQSDPSDDKILLTAIAGTAQVIATRDRHFLKADVAITAARYGIRILREPELLTELGVV